MILVLTRNLFTRRMLAQRRFPRFTMLVFPVWLFPTKLERHLFLTVFRRRQTGAVHLHKGRRHLARIAAGQQFVGQNQFVFAGTFGQQRIGEQPLVINFADIIGRWRIAPGRCDLGAAQHFLGLAAA